MNLVPKETLELILAHLPMVDLLCSFSLVNKQWYQTISRKQFIPWKKLYFAYLSLKDETSKEFLKETCDRQNITSAENCLQRLLHYVAHSVQKNEDFEKTLHLIKIRHPLGNLSAKLIRELFQQQSVAGDLNFSLTWGVTALISMIAPDVWEIYKLINILTDPKSNCTIMEVTEKLYCLSTFYLYFAREFKLPSRIHYNLIYALNLFENCWNIPKEVKPEHSSQQGEMSSLQGRNIRNVQALTHEQSRIVNHQINSNDLIKIVAFAGSGKTTTLLRLTERNPDTRFLLIVYNRAVADDAKRKFPQSNVKCKTVHELAYQHLKRSGLFRNKKICNIYPMNLIEKKILDYNIQGIRKYQREQLVLNTINRFWCSADEFITIDHTPDKITKPSKDHTESISEKILSETQRQLLVRDAQKVWNAIKNPNDKKMGKIPCDAFLKIWQLKRPNLFISENVDCVMVDEGQDMNGAMLAIFLNHSGCRVIVGDPHQQIYRWRNAVNALDKVPSTHTFYLTQSFRFGPEIGFMANSCLELLNNVKSRCLFGGNIRDALGPSEQMSTSRKQKCYLARTNLTIYKKVVQILGLDVSSNSQRPKPKISFAGGLQNMQFDLLIDLFNLQRKAFSDIRNRFLKNQKRFPNYETFVAYVEAVDDREWSAKIAQLKWSGDRTKQYVDVITSSHVDFSEADVVFSTAHKAKGMEWDEVFILDDFTPTLFSTSITDIEKQKEERNLLYVAVTRAKRILHINPACYYTLLAVGEHFERVVDTVAYADKHRTVIKCVKCHKILPGHCQARDLSLSTIPLRVTSINSESVQMASQEGLSCALCSGLPYFSFQKFRCYEHELPTIRVKEDTGHLAFRFLVGPMQHEWEMAEAHYTVQQNLMLGGVVRARQLVMNLQAMPENDAENFPEDDDMVLQAMIAHDAGTDSDDDNVRGVGDEVDEVRDIDQEPIAPSSPQDDGFPDDDDIFPLDDSTEESDQLPTSMSSLASQEHNLNFPSDDECLGDVVLSF